MDTLHESLPLLVVSEGIEHTENGRLLIDGTEPAPSRYRVRLTDDADDPETVLTVPDPDMHTADEGSPSHTALQLLTGWIGQPTPID